MLTKRAFLRRALAGAAAATPMNGAFAQVLRSGVSEDGLSLRERAARRHMFYGCAVNTSELKDNDFVAALTREACMLVAEYEMKRGVIEVAQGQFDFEPADTLLAFSQQHGMAFRGHTLVWHKRNPPWLQAELASSPSPKILTDYITAVAAHYQGRLHSWDVVNEAILPEDARTDSLRNSLWLQAFGPSYIDLAFHAARSADPKALLVYNDQGCEGGASGNDNFRIATLKFLEKALARGVPIDALGLQGHLDAFGPPINQKKLRVFLDEVKSLGLRILVTEHDVDDTGGPSDILTRDRAVADASRSFLDVVLAHDAAITVLTWGLSDRYLDSNGLFASKPRGLPLDAEMKRKPMWYAMAEAFSAL
jgi:endo-1,4-beta-xylanase